MDTRTKFRWFCVAWSGYLVLAMLLLKYLLVPTFGDGPMPVAVVVGFVSYLVGFVAWGPVRGNWKCDGRQTEKSQQAAPS